MKTIITYAFIAAYVLWTLVSCSVFTAPRDPETGIRQDLPPGWSGINPLDTLHDPSPVPTADGRFGRHWSGYREF